MSEEEKNGCFTWCVRLKQACNKRWARVMNRIRRRFYGRMGQRVDPETIIDETGTRDMVLSKTFVDIPDMFATKTDENISCYKTVNGKDFEKQVDEYVANILQAAVNTLTSDVRLTSNTTNMITMDADDNVSLTSSVISQIADIAVTESLSTVAMGNHFNQSATSENRYSPVIFVHGGE